MGRLFDSTPVDDTTVRDVFARNWPGAVLEGRIKSSQNVTFAGTLGDGTKVIVRATATPGCLPRIIDEVEFLRYIVAAGVQACGFIEPGLAVSADGGTVVVVTRWAHGAAPVYTDWLWATDEALVKAQGRWLGSLHAASRTFEAARPDVAARIQLWDSVHDGILAGAPAPALPLTPAHYGICHGDVNASNYFVCDTEPASIDVFDWDQTQRGWFLYDLAQPIWGVTMVAGAGMPMSGERVPQLDPEQFTAWLCEGYGEAVDAVALQACVNLRRELYLRFCKRAQDEGGLPPDMKAFIDWTVAAFDAKLL